MLWYRASITFMLEQTDYSDALPQITRARERFPADGVVQFESGFYQEALAAPRVQALVGPMRGTLAPARTHLDAAEASFKRAVKLDPGFAEARIRLGAVLTRLERYREAEATLRPALDGVQDPVLRYFGEIFLARAAEGLGDLPTARDRYERARAAFPSSEVPLLALGRLARGSGDRARAAELVRLAIEARRPANQPADPWWVYNLWQSRNSVSLFRDLHRSIDTGGRP
jgi:tetratricopeptide (TPR) repeat protein